MLHGRTRRTLFPWTTTSGRKPTADSNLTTLGTWVRQQVCETRARQSRSTGKLNRDTAGRGVLHGRMEMNADADLKVCSKEKSRIGN